MMSHAATPIVPVPAHVPAQRVVDWDFANPPGGETDINAAWKLLHNGPDIVWTPHNGGHWIMTRAEDIEFVQKNHDPFSMTDVVLPPTEMLSILPLEADPPEHAAYRSVINRFLAPKAVSELDSGIRELTVSLIEAFRERGECEFIDEFAKKLPITIFMRLVDLPLEDLDDLFAWTEEAVRGNAERKAWAQQQLFGYLGSIIQQRQQRPGADMISAIVNAQVFGRSMTPEEINGMLANVVFGGLDTVTSLMGFTALHLARHPELRQQLREKPELIPTAVEEMLRMFAPSSTARLIMRDFQYKDVLFKAGDRLYIRPILHGMDERKFACPMHADFERKNAAQHAAFGNGPHRCAGALLARAELRIFLEEWFRRIPDFQLKPGEQPRFEGGMVNCVTRVPLVWQVAEHGI
ncbi:cytochrome P450 [Pseudomonas sp. SJZ103]|nr:cytochrome P450 [Pseudomonas sp. SJZ103]TWC76469.1 cytochrome P450 [Pseudomonas sp. SJZ094]